MEQVYLIEGTIMAPVLRVSALAFAVATLSSVVAACAGEDAGGRSAESQETAAADTGQTGMQGMAGMGSRGMMSQMRAHMRMMDSASTDSARAMMPMHRQMVANMISQMNREMRNMNMSGDAAWTATMDSVRQDLVRLPELNAAELRDFMPAHRTRVLRLMDMHGRMMGGGDR